MKFKLALSTATALGLLMGGALAGSDNEGRVFQSGDDNFGIIVQAGDKNRSVIQQNGDDNSSDVWQSGNSNRAGRTSYNDQLRQEGDNNDILVRQNGNQNHIGVNYTSGVWQKSDQNKLTITQTSTESSNSVNGNRVWQVLQTGTDGASSTVNSVTITQKGTTGLTTENVRATNHVGLIQQIHGGGSANTVVVNQTGEEHTHHGGRQGNVLTTLIQDGSGNSATVDQLGHGFTDGNNRLVGPQNRVSRLEQNGNNNTAALYQEGFQNNHAAAGPFLGYAADVGVTIGHAIQLGDGNTIRHGVVGNHNLFGFHQDGGSNIIMNAAGHNVGDRNQVAIYQLGDSNQSTFYQGGGDGNIAGITGIGDVNNLGFWQEGDNNTGRTEVNDGNWNVGQFHQFGDNHDAKLFIDGDMNAVVVQQYNSNNTADVSITGDQNGGGAPVVSAAAATAHGLFKTAITGSGATLGLIKQDGLNNDGQLTVTGNFNAFAFLQEGSLNSFDVTSTGHSNAVLGVQKSGLGNANPNTATVTQLGSNNFAQFNQSGGGNSANIAQ